MSLPVENVASVAPSWSTLLSRRYLAASVVLCGGVAIHAVFIYVVATILPAVVGEIGGVAYYAWSTTLFMVGSIAGAASAARASERLGPRAAYRIALVTFTTGSVVCALAPQMGVLVGGRLLQGTGGGLLTALAYATIRQVFPAALHARAIAMVSGIWGIAALSGPLVGGLFARMGVWRPAFWTAVVCSLPLAALAERVLPPAATAGRAAPLPIGRLALLAGAVLAVSIGSVPGTTGASLAGLVSGLGLLGAMFSVERRAAHALLPSGAFRISHPLGPISLTMLLLTLASSAMAFLPYILTVSYGLTPLVAGYLIAIEALAWTVTALLTAAVEGARVRRLLVASPLVAFAGMAGIGLALPAGSLVALAGAVALVGTGIGLAWAHLANLMISCADEAQRDLAAASISTIQLLAAAFGSAIAGVVANLAGLAGGEATPGLVGRAGTVLFECFALAPALAIFLALRVAAIHRRRGSSTR
jgi:predicted MFS family arabinose efflux permease